MVLDEISNIYWRLFPIVVFQMAKNRIKQLSRWTYFTSSSNFNSQLSCLIGCLVLSSLVPVLFFRARASLYLVDNWSHFFDWLLSSHAATLSDGRQSYFKSIRRVASELEILREISRTVSVPYIYLLFLISFTAICWWHWNRAQNVTTFAVSISFFSLLRLFPSMILQKVHVSRFRFPGWRAISSFSNDRDCSACGKITKLISIKCAFLWLSLMQRLVSLSRFTQIHSTCLRRRYLKKVVSSTA